MPGGQYDDTLTLTLRVPGPNPTTTAAVRIFAPASCTMTVPPNVSFTYTAFGPTVLASSVFSATCTTLMPYTMSLDSTAGNVIGLDYALGLNTLGVGSLATTGTGAAQSYTILGSMAAGQAGICVGGVCPGSQGHTVTISY